MIKSKFIMIEIEVEYDTDSEEDMHDLKRNVERIEEALVEVSNTYTNSGSTSSVTNVSHFAKKSGSKSG